MHPGGERVGTLLLDRQSIKATHANICDWGDPVRIDRLTVRNFRNLADVDIQLLPGTVIVGENRVGKTNLVHALRLILDSRLSYADRQLTRDDFWDGLSNGQPGWDPMVAGEVIEASIDIVDFADDPAVLVAAHGTVPTGPCAATGPGRPSVRPAAAVVGCRPARRPARLG